MRYHTEQLGFHTFHDTIAKAYKKEFSRVDDEFIREECETNWEKLPKHLKRHYEFLGLNLSEVKQNEIEIVKNFCLSIQCGHRTTAR